MHATTTKGRGEGLWRLGVPDEGWAMYAAPAGERDLGTFEMWERSLVRSRLRRESAAARRPGLRKGAKAKVAAALLGATLVAPLGQAASAQAAPTTHVTGVLKKGDSGAKVKALQRALGVTADGEFGAATQRALKAYQRSHGLTADGIAGPMTQAKLGTGSAAKASTRSSAASSGSSSSSASGTKGVKGLSKATIKRVQAKLGVAADGAWGAQSRKALRAFQRSNGLEVDGVVGPATLAKLGVSSSASSGSSSGSSSSTSSADEGSSGSGSSSSAVAAARAQIGKPYASGGNGPSSFDCSGLTVWAMKKAGVSLPRTSFAQYGQGSSVSKGNIRAGDLVFFNTAGAGASHVGVATSSSSVISATSHGVMEHSFTSGYWSQHYVGARRV